MVRNNDSTGENIWKHRKPAMIFFGALNPTMHVKTKFKKERTKRTLTDNTSKN